MKGLSLFSILFFFAVSIKAQPGVDTTRIIDTASLDMKALAQELAGNAKDNFGKAKNILNWLSKSFAWTATDYSTRTVKQILVRRGGNCFELARVYMALIKELGINYRPVAEVNLHVQSERRKNSAEQKVKEAGNRMSVFGFQHNDHRWIEVYDDKSKEWIPVDPTTNLIGFDNWLKGRAWFGERHTLNDDLSHDMITPFAIWVVDPNNSARMVEERTVVYMVEKLNALYANRLANLPSWKAYTQQLQELSKHANNAFAGTENLHDYNDLIEKFRITYEKLKVEFANR